MGLSIDCHSLFEVQLCLSLHIEVLSFEDGEWSRDDRNGVPSGEIGTFPTYSSL